jgi:hypothetical protein
MACLPDFPKNVMAIFHGGKPVSTIARLERDILIHGCKLRMGYIGGVCTHPDHRGRGLASAIQSAQFNRMRENGVDFVHISGARPMYYGAGANHIGGFSQFCIPPYVVDCDLHISSREAAPQDLPLLCRLNELDGTRFARPAEDYAAVLSCGHCAGRPCEFHVVETMGEPVAYLFAFTEEQEGVERLHIVEVRGDRVAVLSALARLAFRGQEHCSVTVDVAHGDLLEALLSAHDLVGQPGRTGGVVKVLDFCRTMNRLKPHLASHFSGDFVDSLEFLDAGTRYLAVSEEGTLTMDGEASMLWTLLGAPAGQGMAAVEAVGRMAEVLHSCLPLPLPSVHLNMI